MQAKIKKKTNKNIKQKHKTKAQMNWEISKEQEEKFRRALDRDILNGIDVDELFKLIRGAEYRRGKEDGIKECKEENRKTPKSLVGCGEVHSQEKSHLETPNKKQNSLDTTLKQKGCKQLYDFNKKVCGRDGLCEQCQQLEESETELKPFDNSNDIGYSNSRQKRTC